MFNPPPPPSSPSPSFVVTGGVAGTLGAGILTFGLFDAAATCTAKAAELLTDEILDMA
jgi:hypothetical protein